MKKTALQLNLSQAAIGITVLVLAASFICLINACGGQETKTAGRTHSNYGLRKPVSYEALKKNFKDPDMIYSPFIFWFWDEPLNADKMGKMSAVMSSEGFNPGYAHARRSMVGTPDLPDSEWLGDKWFEAFGAALKQAEAHKTYLGYCDEYWWPSLQANGRVLKAHPELEAVSLSWDTIDVPSACQVKVPSSFFAVAAQLDKAIDVAAVKEPKITMGKWIWHPDAGETKHSCWFRKEFEIPVDRKAVQAVLKIVVDNAYTLYVNGKKIGEGSNWEKTDSYDVTTSLKTGKNIIAIEANNIDGPFGLLFGMTVVLDDGKTIDIRSDNKWIASLKSANGWEQSEFEPNSWAAAREIADTGAAPWNYSDGKALHKTALIRSNTLNIIGAGDAFDWTSPADGSYRIYVFNKYHHPGADSGQVNYIDERLGKAFIEIALEPYERQFGKKLGSSIPGDFIDNEGDYGWRLAWSGTLDSRYKERYGRDIRQWLPLMADKDVEGLYSKARWEWFDVVSDIYAETFRSVTDWHEQRGMYTTAHVWEESIPAQVQAVGDHMKILRAFTMPGQDCLGRKSLCVHDFKEIESVAEFENVRAATELMGAGGFEGKEWGTFTPPFLKQSINAAIAWGMSHIIPHGVFTTRKLTGNPWPPDWYSENPMFPYLNLWTDFSRRASYINSMGQAVPDVLLYNPLESAWILADYDLFDAKKNMAWISWVMPQDTESGRRMNYIDRVYTKAITDLTDARVEFLIGDRYYLGQMEVKGRHLMRGEFSFKTLVLPPIDILTLDAARKIVDFAKAGGCVYALGELPTASADNGANDLLMINLMEDLRKQPFFTACPNEPVDCPSVWTYGPGWQYRTDPNQYGLKSLLTKSALGLDCPVKFISGAFTMLQHRRRIDGRDFFWLVNNTSSSQSCRIFVSAVHGAASIWDCENGQISPVNSSDSKDGSRLSLTFKPYEAYWLVFDKQNTAYSLPVKSQESEAVMQIDGPWKVTFDPNIQPTMEFPMTPPAEFALGTEKSLEDWSEWGLKKFSGLLDYTKTVNINKIEGKLFLDLGKVCHAAEVYVNGKTCGAWLWEPHILDISDALKNGDNEIRVRVANLINNSYGDIQESGLFGPVKIVTEGTGQRLE